MAKCKHPKFRRTMIRAGWTKHMCTKCGHWYIKTVTSRIITKEDD